MKTFGKLTLDKARWQLDVEPHVALRAKRVFAGIAKDVKGTLRISDTIDNCRDLLWFIERYPLEVDVGRLERLKDRSAAHQDRQSLVDSLLSDPTQSAVFQLARPPREYQRIAASLALASGGLLVGDELGLGKTIVGICMLTDPRTRPALVVAPTHLQRQWKEKLEEFAPNLSVHVIRQGTPYDYRAGKQKRGLKLPVVLPHPDVLIITYSKLTGWASTLAGLIKGVIYDEVHELRSGPQLGERGSAKGTAAQQISNAAEFRLGLSGTPIFNYGGEIYHVLQALRPWALGSIEEFREEWCDGAADKPRLKDPAAFGSYARASGLMIRRTRKDVGRELPELTKIVHHVDSDPAALDAIRSSATELAKIILNQAGRELSRGEQFRAGGELDARIRQATGIAKAPYVAEFVKMLLESEQKILLAGWHRTVFDIWLEALKEFHPVMYTGSESEAAKERAKKAFCEGESRVMLISLRSGAGLDGLQYSGCRTVVHGELDWSYSVHEQLTARPHRDGQSEPVASYYPISDSGSDPIVADVLGVKREQLDGLRDPLGATSVERIDTGEHIKRLAEEMLRRRAA